MLLSFAKTAAPFSRSDVSHRMTSCVLPAVPARLRVHRRVYLPGAERDDMGSALCKEGFNSAVLSEVQLDSFSPASFSRSSDIVSPIWILEYRPQRTGIASPLPSVGDLKSSHSLLSSQQRGQAAFPAGKQLASQMHGFMVHFALTVRSSVMVVGIVGPQPSKGYPALVGTAGAVAVPLFRTICSA